MKYSINWKKLVIWFAIILPLLLLLDIVTDALKGPIKWDEIWAMKNLFFKVAAALVGGYFISTFKNS
jgi:cytochrome c oxidase subunit IV